jgi:hypothetical protein
MPVHVRVCPDCGEEYRPEIVTCADCGAVLEDRFLGEEEEAADAAPPAAPLPEEQAPDLSHHQVLFTSGQARDLVPLAEALKAKGVAFRLVDTPALEEVRAASYRLLVHQDDGAAAQRALAPLLAAAGAGEDAAPGSHEAPGDTPTEARCPACGQQLEAGALECPECGLGLAAEEEG